MFGRAAITLGIGPHSSCVSSSDVLLHPPRMMICNRRCCLVVCWLLCAKTSERICMKFSGKFGSGASNKPLNFGGYTDH